MKRILLGAVAILVIFGAIKYNSLNASGWSSGLYTITSSGVVTELFVSTIAENNARKTIYFKSKTEFGDDVKLLKGVTIQTLLNVPQIKETTFSGGATFQTLINPKQIRETTFIQGTTIQGLLNPTGGIEQFTLKQGATFYGLFKPLGGIEESEFKQGATFYGLLHIPQGIEEIKLLQGATIQGLIDAPKGMKELALQQGATIQGLIHAPVGMQELALLEGCTVGTFITVPTVKCSTIVPSSPLVIAGKLHLPTSDIEAQGATYYGLINVPKVKVSSYVWSGLVEPITSVSATGENVTATRAGTGYTVNIKDPIVSPSSGIASGVIPNTVRVSSAGAGIVAPENTSATGTPSATTYWRGDNTWSTVSASGGGFTTYYWQLGGAGEAFISSDTVCCIPNAKIDVPYSCTITGGWFFNVVTSTKGATSYAVIKSTGVDLGRPEITSTVFASTITVDTRFSQTEACSVDCVAGDVVTLWITNDPGSGYAEEYGAILRVFRKPD